MTFRFDHIGHEISAGFFSRKREINTGVELFGSGLTRRRPFTLAIRDRRP
jgi:hypothetical protein